MPHKESQTIHPTQQLSGSALSHLPITDPSQEGQQYRILNDKIIEALQCKLSNYENSPALDVTFDLTVFFRKVVRRSIVVSEGDIVDQRTFHLSLGPLIGKIDPGPTNSITLYIANRSQQNGITIAFPKMISAHLLNEQTVQSFRLTSTPTVFLLPERPIPQ